MVYCLRLLYGGWGMLDAEDYMRPLILVMAISASAALLSACAGTTGDPESWRGEAIRKAVAAESPTSRELFEVCELMALYGEYVGEARTRGVRVNVAMTEAADQLVRATDLEPGDALALNARVFAVLAYRLDEDHAPAVVGAYTLLACMTIYGLDKTMPVDVRSEETVNERLRRCGESSRGRDDLGACVIDRLAPIVKQGV